MKCSNCGKDIMDVGNFCEFCGVALKKEHRLTEITCKNCGNRDLEYFNKEYLRLQDPQDFGYLFHVFICKKCNVAEFRADFPLRKDYLGKKIKT